MAKDMLGRKVEFRRDKTTSQLFVDKIKYTLKAGWIFNHPIEKIILILMMIWSVYSFIKYIIS